MYNQTQEEWRQPGTGARLRGGGKEVECVHMCVCVCLCVCVWPRKSMRVLSSAQELYHLNITNSIIYKKKKWGSLVESICLFASLQQEVQRISAYCAQNRCKSLDQNTYTLTALGSAFVCLQQAHICTSWYIYIFWHLRAHLAPKQRKRKKGKGTNNKTYSYPLRVLGSVPSCSSRRSSIRASISHQNGKKEKGKNNQEKGRKEKYDNTHSLALG